VVDALRRSVPACDERAPSTGSWKHEPVATVTMVFGLVGAAGTSIAALADESLLRSDTVRLEGTHHEP